MVSGNKENKKSKLENRMSISRTELFKLIGFQNNCFNRNDFDTAKIISEIMFDSYYTENLDSNRNVSDMIKHFQSLKGV